MGDILPNKINDKESGVVNLGINLKNIIVIEYSFDELLSL